MMWKKINNIFSSVLILNYCLLATICAVYIRTKLGNVKGIVLTSRNGNKFNAFLGVPYAKPPVGDLRLENPVLVEPWNDTFDATKYPPVCPQLEPKGITGVEDCLYLNIYTPQLYANNNTKLPVWVFIYGGRRLLGHALPHKYGPQYIMDKPIILITVSYRIGPLGFLSTEDSAIPGNYGLKDQTLVLRWIKHYISDFGGDSSNVTLAGGSSGAADVSLHLLSPLSKGLFHRGISQSGQALNFWSIMKPGRAREHTWQYAKFAGCSNNEVKTSEKLLKCLKSKPIDVLLFSTVKLMHDFLLPDTMFGAVIEHKYVNEPFLIESPATAIQKSTSIPYLLGVTGNEGSLGSIVLYSNQKAVKHVTTHYKKIFPEFFGYELASDVEQITQILLEKYLNNNFSSDSYYPFAKIFGSSHAYVGAMETALQYRGPTYFYVYDYVNHPDYTRNYGGIRQGASKGMYVEFDTAPVHGEELMSMFYYSDLFPPIIEGEDRVISEKVLSLWCNFVTYGDPNGKDGNQIWQPVTTPNVEYLHIQNSSFEMKNRLYWEDYEFWKALGNPVTIQPNTSVPLWNEK